MMPEGVPVDRVSEKSAMAVPLTTIDQQTRKIGARAAELLLEQIESKRPLRAAKTLFVPELVPRKSTQR